VAGATQRPAGALAGAESEIGRFVDENLEQLLGELAEDAAAAAAEVDRCAQALIEAHARRQRVAEQVVRLVGMTRPAMPPGATPESRSSAAVVAYERLLAQGGEAAPVLTIPARVGAEAVPPRVNEASMRALRIVLGQGGPPRDALGRYVPCTMVLMNQEFLRNLRPARRLSMAASDSRRLRRATRLPITPSSSSRWRGRAASDRSSAEPYPRAWVGAGLPGQLWAARRPHTPATGLA
jgi:hypothetical protein